MRKATCLAVSLLLVSSTCPVKTTASQQTDEPPSIPLDFQVVTPEFKEVKVGKSYYQEKQEKLREEALKTEKLKAKQNSFRVATSSRVSLSLPSTSGYTKIIGTSSEQCVQYYQRITGDYSQRGYAGNFIATKNTPKVGGGALSKNFGHISVVVAISGDFLIVHDANWIPGKITERKVPRSSFRGYVW